MSAEGRLFVVSGPSGAGKGTLIRAALRRRPDIFASVSVTTREPRPGERDGVDYRFVPEPTFREMIASGDLLEWAEVYGELYGTPRAPVAEARAQGRDVLLELDIQGAVTVKGADPSAILVFVEPPSMAALAERLRGRGTEDPDALARRIEAGYGEVKAAGAYDHIVVNDDLDAATEEFLRILDGRTTRKDET